MTPRRANARGLEAEHDRRRDGIDTASAEQREVAGTTSLDLDDDLEAVRFAIVSMFSDCVDVISRHFAIADRRRRRSFAGLVLTAIEGGYIRGRAEHSTRALKDAAAWLAEIVKREASAAP